jgi:hypothetical protein
MLMGRVENKGYIFHADQVRFGHGGIVFFGGFIFMVRQRVVGQGRLIVEASQSHSVTHTTLGRIPSGE